MTEPGTSSGAVLWSWLAAPSPVTVETGRALILAIEAEATAAAEQRLAGLREALRGLVDAHRLGREHRPCICAAHEDARRALLDPAPELVARTEEMLDALRGPASPRQGEPVEGHEHEWKYAPDWDRESAVKAGYRAMECFPCRAVMWVSPARAALSEPAEAET